MRNAYWDQVRGVSIIAVVAIHASGPSFAFPTNSLNFNFALILRQLVDFAVPIFLATAGYFATKNPINGIFDFYQARISRIAWPYIFWTFVYILLLKPRDLLAPGALIFDIFAGKGISIGYFVIVLIQMVLLTPLIIRLSTFWHHLIFMVAGTILGLALTYFLQILHSDSWFAAFPQSALPFVVWYPFYHLGIVLYQLQLAGRLALPRISILFSIYIFGLILSIFESKILVSDGFIGFSQSQIRFSSIFTSVSLFLLIVSVSRIHFVLQAPWLSWIGRNSYFIYLTHLLVFRAIIIAISRIQPIMDFQPAYIAILVVGSISICSAAVYVARRILPSIWQTRLLG